MKQEPGYIALVSAVIISMLLMTITFALSMTGFSVRFNILDAEYKERSVALADACVDTALLKYAADPAYNPTNESNLIGSDNCTVVSVTPAGSQTIIKTSATFQKAVTNVKAVVETATLSVTTWEECSIFSACPP